MTFDLIVDLSPSHRHKTRLAAHRFLAWSLIIKQIKGFAKKINHGTHQSVRWSVEQSYCFESLNAVLCTANKNVSVPKKDSNNTTYFSREGVMSVIGVLCVCVRAWMCIYSAHLSPVITHHSPCLLVAPVFLTSSRVLHALPDCSRNAARSDRDSCSLSSIIQSQRRKALT